LHSFNQTGPKPKKQRAARSPYRELPMDRKITAAVFYSSVAPSPSRRGEPRRRHPLSQSRVVANPSPRAAPSPSPRPESRRRHPFAAGHIVAIPRPSVSPSPSLTERWRRPGRCRSAAFPPRPGAVQELD
jgi:hypothetical protein